MTESNVVNISSAMTRDEIRAKAIEKYAPEDFTPPDWDGHVKLRRLKTIEQEELYSFLQENANVSIFRYNAKVCAFGLVEPRLTYEEAMEMPSDFLAACRERIDAKSVRTSAEEKKAADGPVPFVDLNSSGTDSPSPSPKPSPKSTPSTKT